MRLHYHPVSPYSRKVRVAMLHRGEAADARVVDVRTGELGSAAFLALSPFGKMPVLETDDGPLFESSTILEWLEHRGPRALLPRGAEGLARHWDRIGDLYLIDAQTEIWFRPETAADARRNAHTAWRLLDEHLADGREFVCGRHFTLGDLGPAIATDYLERLGEAVPERIYAWKERCFAIPAMAEALEEALPGIAAMLGARSARMAAV